MSLRRPLLLPLVPVYAAGLRLERWLQGRHRAARRSLKDVVLSVGSVSAGGAGKTPVVLALARILHQREYAVRILSRGYQRSSKQVEQVDPAGDATRFGDEPLLLAQRSGVPVVVGADRYAAGLVAQAIPGNALVVHLLDDGLQHRQLARNLDIVLLTREDVDDVLLPAGNLREPLPALRHADVIVLRDNEAGPLEDFISVLTRETGPPAIWHIHRSLHLAAPISASPSRPFVFCAIARPESFTSMLADGAVVIAGRRSFPDHHHYTEQDIDRLLAQARSAKADGFITTEKDAVKLSPGMRSRLEGLGPLVVPELLVTFLDERRVLADLIGMVPRLDRRLAPRHDAHDDTRSDHITHRRPDRRGNR